MLKPLLLLVALLTLKGALLLAGKSYLTLVINVLGLIWLAVFAWLVEALWAPTVPKRIRYSIGGFLIVYGMACVAFVVDTITNVD